MHYTLRHALCHNLARSVILLLAVTILTACGSAVAPIDLVALEPIATSAPAQAVAFAPAGEIIVIVGRAPCDTNEARVDGVCTPVAFSDFLCEQLGICRSKPGEPPEGAIPPLPPGGAGGGRPLPPKPTEKQCENAFKTCQSYAASEGRERCLADETRLAALIVYQNNDTCIGDASELWEDLPPVVDLSGIPYNCSGSDLYPDNDNEYHRQQQQACVARFHLEALLQCSNGRRGVRETAGVGFKSTITLKGFADLGFDATTSVTVLKEGGAGFRQYCTAALQKASREACSAARDQCLVAAKGGTGLVTPLERPSIEELLGMIDRRLLGLDTQTGMGIPNPNVEFQTGDFHDTQKQDLELDELYRTRLQFLADWSRFLKASNLTAVQRRRLYTAFKRTQYSFTNTDEDLLGYTLGAWTLDPETGNLGTEEARQQFQRFIETRQFFRLATRDEGFLLQEVRSVLGQEGYERFMAQVWPGIYQFGFSRPMKEGIVVGPG